MVHALVTPSGGEDTMQGNRGAKCLYIPLLSRRSFIAPHSYYGRPLALLA
jgi:hypothetical protein